jgi:hypothetical protein
VTEPGDTAVGDALGSGVEFDSIERIRARLGPAGVTDYVEAYGRRGAITDDTQMTLFTAEGLLLADDGAEVRAVVDRAYARWLAIQGERSPRWADDDGGGWGARACPRSAPSGPAPWRRRSTRARAAAA